MILNRLPRRLYHTLYRLWLTFLWVAGLSLVVGVIYSIGLLWDAYPITEYITLGTLLVGTIVLICYNMAGEDVENEQYFMTSVENKLKED